ncbi:hypothetical protein AOZ06_12150 [Kibdelosporangium phytohabitans]|uniref:Transposase IS116/IS110/IS902 C-terminal domain-containing protein n=1 Tax=Kibdelosporangium phytohabitans TaxID=860235 RepID=A0A0N9HWQ7_9PSEU|nr:hypothetical protein AOZ06_12150 [Kibdelosporangium phytohabitans]
MAGWVIRPGSPRCPLTDVALAFGGTASARRIGGSLLRGLVPRLNSSGLTSHHSGLTKSGDACLREALFMAAQQVRRTGPTLAAKYHRLMTESGKHHISALCHVATALLTRIAARWRRDEHYRLTGLDGTPITTADARQLITERYTVPAELRVARRATHQHRRTNRRHKEPRSAPTNSPRTTQPTDTHAA